MPLGPRVNYETLAVDFSRYLQNGVLSAADACRFLGISQPTFSRFIKKFKNRFFSVGRARQVRYALRREIPGVGLSFPIHEISSDGKTFRLGVLHGIYPAGFYFESYAPKRMASRFFEDLPYFLNDVRPSGFLGRLIPQKYSDLNLPKDINAWSANDCLRYLTRHGSDLVGNLILGDAAFRKYLTNQTSRVVVTPEDRARVYPKMADDVLRLGDPGSSAGGEQPKFSAVVGYPPTDVLVKFSPPASKSETGRRIADLLLCEHISLGLLEKAGVSAAHCEIIFGGDRLFLEVRRFDRITPSGRRGVISLGVLDAEFSGKGQSWVERSKGLLEEGIITGAADTQIRWRQLYGRLIANTDMHPGNLSFYLELPNTAALAPVYDMLPMLYMPQGGQVLDQTFTPPMPDSGDADIWLSAWTAACSFWQAVSRDERISETFRAIAAENLKKLNAQDHLADLLPQKQP